MSAHELTLSADEVITMLQQGRLASTDLVFADGGWSALAESVYFEDAAHAAARRERFSRNLPYIATVLAFVGVGLIVAFLQIVARYR